MTGEYTFGAPERQNELTRRIQEKLAAAAPKQQAITDQPPLPTPGAAPHPAELQLVTSTIQ